MNVTLYGRTFSQSSAATEFRCGGRFYFTVFRSLSKNPKVKELLKSVHIYQSYRKNKSGTFFNGPRCSYPHYQRKGYKINSPARIVTDRAKKQSPIKISTRKPCYSIPGRKARCRCKFR